MKFKNQKFNRELKIETKGVDKDERTVELAFSSDAPYERTWGMEVLDHSPESVDLDRINNGGALLVNHDLNDQVGVVESAWVDADQKARAKVRFGKSKRANEIFNDVKDGIRRLVSVAYEIRNIKETKREGKPPLMRVTDWMPLEVSIVSVPADSSVGIGRSKKVQDEPEIINEDIKMTKEVKESAQEVKQERTIEAPAIQKVDVDKIRKDELARMNSIRELGDQFDAEELAREYISDGKSAADFQTAVLHIVGERNNKARSKSDFNGDVDLSPKEENRYSLLRALYAASNPSDKRAQEKAAFELEVSREGENQIGNGFSARGVYVPENVLRRDLSAGTATDGAELVADELLAGSFIEFLRNNTVVRQAGATVLSGLVGNQSIPRQTAGAALTWVDGEGTAATESEAQFDQVTLTPNDGATYTEVTRRLIQQSTPSIEGLVRRDLARAIAVGTDAAALYGTGANGQPLGIAIHATTGVNTLDLAAADPTYAETIEMIKLVMDDNALMGNLSFIIDPNGWAAGKTTEKATNTAQFLIGDTDTLNGYPVRVTPQVADEDWFFGDWSSLLIGEWGGLDITVDPYTQALSGNVRFIVFKTMDTAIRHPESFCFASDAVV